MQIHRHALLCALALCCGAYAQDPKTEAAKADPAQVAMADFYNCAKKYSEKYSKSREPAQDIADAALSYCENPRERLRGLLIDKLSAGGRSAREQVNALFPGIIEKARLLSIRTVVEARYEATLKAGAAQSATAQPAAPAPTTGVTSPAAAPVTSAVTQPPLPDGTSVVTPLALPEGTSVVTPLPLPAGTNAVVLPSPPASTSGAPAAVTTSVPQPTAPAPTAGAAPPTRAAIAADTESASSIKPRPVSPPAGTAAPRPAPAGSAVAPDNSAPVMRPPPAPDI